MREDDERERGRVGAVEERVGRRRGEVVGDGGVGRDGEADACADEPEEGLEDPGLAEVEEAGVALCGLADRALEPGLSGRGRGLVRVGRVEDGGEDRVELECGPAGALEGGAGEGARVGAGGGRRRRDGEFEVEGRHRVLARVARKGLAEEDHGCFGLG